MGYGGGLVAEESWLCWEEGEWICDVHARPRRTVLRKTATEDGAAEVGATEDGATEDAVSGTHGLGGPCYGRRLRKTVLRWVGAAYEKTRKTQGIAGS